MSIQGTGSTIGGVRLTGDSASKVDGLNLSLNNSVSLGFQCAPLAMGKGNTFMGYNAAQFVKTGDNNTCFGYSVSPYVSGFGNTLIGAAAANYMMSAHANTAIGASAGDGIVAGSSNAIVGFGAGGSTSHSSCGVGLGHLASFANNAISLGCGARATGDYSIAIGTDCVAESVGRFNILDRLHGYFASGGSRKTDTYNVQADCDVLRLGGATLALCPPPPAGRGTPAQARWVMQLGPERSSKDPTNSNAVFADLLLRSSNNAVVRFTDEFAPSIFNFTGQHRCVWSDANHAYTSCDTQLVGCVVSSTGSYQDLDGRDAVRVDEAIPEVELSRGPYDPRVFGVVAGPDALSSDGDSRVFSLGNVRFDVPRTDTREGHAGACGTHTAGARRLLVNAAGEGAVWVCNAGGPLRNGDLLTTSPHPGLAMRQDGAAVLNTTVAKITCDCDFASNVPGPVLHTPWPPGIECAPEVSRVLVGCTYKC